MSPREINILIERALEARTGAYAPYSTFAVGAALQTRDGRIFQGCNIENISFSLTMCAERVALGAAHAAGANNLVGVAVVADSREPIMPCGACRQVLAEFNPELLVISSTLSGVITTFNLSFLLPNSRQGILDRST